MRCGSTTLKPAVTRPREKVGPHRAVEQEGIPASVEGKIAKAVATIHGRVRPHLGVLEATDQNLAPLFFSVNQRRATRILANAVGTSRAAPNQDQSREQRE